jgi:hypothetical protein
MPIAWVLGIRLDQALSNASNAAFGVRATLEVFNESDIRRTREYQREIVVRHGKHVIHAVLGSVDDHDVLHWEVGKGSETLLPGTLRRRRSVSSAATRVSPSSLMSLPGTGGHSRQIFKHS